MGQQIPFPGNVKAALAFCCIALILAVAVVGLHFTGLRQKADGLLVLPMALSFMLSFSLFAAQANENRLEFFSAYSWGFAFLVIGMLSAVAHFAVSKKVKMNASQQALVLKATCLLSAIIAFATPIAVAPDTNGTTIVIVYLTKDCQEGATPFGGGGSRDGDGCITSFADAMDGKQKGAIAFGSFALIFSFGSFVLHFFAPPKPPNHALLAKLSLPTAFSFMLSFSLLAALINGRSTELVFAYSSGFAFLILGTLASVAHFFVSKKAAASSRTGGAGMKAAAAAMQGNPVAANANVAKAFCTNCGAQVGSSVAFCTSCGAKMAASVEMTEMTATATELAAKIAAFAAATEAAFTGEIAGANIAHGDDHGAAGRERSTTGYALEARQDPESLIGQRICVGDMGVGTVTGVKKAKGKSTQHLVAFSSNPTAPPVPVLLAKHGKGKGLKFYVMLPIGAAEAGATVAATAATAATAAAVAAANDPDVLRQQLQDAKADAAAAKVKTAEAKQVAAAKAKTDAAAAKAKTAEAKQAAAAKAKADAAAAKAKAAEAKQAAAAARLADSDPTFERHREYYSIDRESVDDHRRIAAIYLSKHHPMVPSLSKRPKKVVALSEKKRKMKELRADRILMIGGGVVNMFFPLFIAVSTTALLAMANVPAGATLVAVSEARACPRPRLPDPGLTLLPCLPACLPTRSWYKTMAATTLLGNLAKLPPRLLLRAHHKFMLQEGSVSRWSSWVEGSVVFISFLLLFAIAEGVSFYLAYLSEGVCEKATCPCMEPSFMDGLRKCTITGTAQCPIYPAACKAAQSAGSQAASAGLGFSICPCRSWLIVALLGIGGLVLNTVKSMITSFFWMIMLAHNFPDFVLHQVIARYTRARALTHAIAHSSFLLLHASRACASCISQLNTNHRKYSVDLETAEALKDANPVKYSTLQTWLGYEKIVRGGGEAYPAPLAAKFLAIMIGERALLFASPMYEHWQVNRRYTLSGGLLSNWFADCRDIMKNFSVHLREVNKSGFDHVGEQALAEADELGISAELPEFRRKTVASFHAIIEDLAVSEAIELEMYLDCCDDASATLGFDDMDSPYMKRGTSVALWLACYDMNINVLSRRRKVPGRVAKVRSGTFEPRAIVRDLAPGTTPFSAKTKAGEKRWGRMYKYRCWFKPLVVLGMGLGYYFITQHPIALTMPTPPPTPVTVSNDDF
jgi:hypothetical protein